ncbi:uncharacterized protein Dwil_GK26964 [Drosophila willistoni]|uniref:Uncharacterized protein n=1 Tax=Drosophila willistoni TaxID=7260 RepID=A0A0Q9WRY8_DROWI|nr:uncharacterized protein LOC26528966 [Drosophila willistoni]KRF98365.1 uncharacterized protein Dwil_GK26964 [Drosophila willistoni]
MFNKCSVFVALICIGFVSCGTVVRRDAPAPAKEVTLQSAIDDTNAFFLKLFNVTSNEEAEKKLKEGGQNLITTADAFLGKIKTEADKFKDSDAFKQLHDSAVAFGEDLKKKHPQTAADVEDVGKSLTNLTSKIGGLGDTEEAKQLNALGQAFASEIAKAATNLFNSVGKAPQ